MSDFTDIPPTPLLLKISAAVRSKLRSAAE